MLFNSVIYLIFLPIVVLLYYLFPSKIKQLWLLVASYYFYMCWNKNYVLLIFLSTLITYVCGLLLEQIKVREWKEKTIVLCKKLTVAISLLLNFGVLFYYKYINFTIDTINKGINFAGWECKIQNFDIILPVGISFFTFQAVGYTIDVYRDEIEAEKNFVRYALFVSFFPQLVAGPIERSKNLLNQLKKIKPFDVVRAESGLFTIAYGLFLKIVIADNISSVIDPVFKEVTSYTGMELCMASMLFAFQVYCDFNGYTKMAIGSAQILGYRLHENFDAPYLAVSVKDFWRRWHISLTSWFRDYLYIPLGGSKKGILRKQINIIIVYLCSGLWHGAAWHYVIWGGLNGLLSVAEDVCNPIRKKCISFFRIDDNRKIYRVFRRVVTFILIDVTWVFFRAEAVGDAFYIIKATVRDFRLEWFINIGFENMFASSKIMFIIAVSLLILFVVDLLKTKGINLEAVVFRQQIVFRWGFYWFFFLVILYWGAYGQGYEQKQFIYFQF